VWEWVGAVFRVADPLIVVIGRLSEGVVGSGYRAVEPLAIGSSGIWIHVSDVRAVVRKVEAMVALG
jgi:hypothetical protein